MKQKNNTISLSKQQTQLEPILASFLNKNNQYTNNSTSSLPVGHIFMHVLSFGAIFGLIWRLSNQEQIINELQNQITDDLYLPMPHRTDFSISTVHTPLIQNYRSI